MYKNATYKKFKKHTYFSKKLLIQANICFFIKISMFFKKLGGLNSLQGMIE